MPPKSKDKERVKPGNIGRNSLRSWISSSANSTSDIVERSMADTNKGSAGHSGSGREAERDAELTNPNSSQTELVSTEQSMGPPTELSAMETRLMGAFQKLNDKIDTIDKTTKDMKVELENRLEKVESKLTVHNKKLGDIEGSANYAHRDITEQKEKMVAVEKDARNLRNLSAGRTGIHW